MACYTHTQEPSPSLLHNIVLLLVFLPGLLLAGWPVTGAWPDKTQPGQLGHNSCKS